MKKANHGAKSTPLPKRTRAVTMQRARRIPSPELQEEYIPIPIDTLLLSAYEYLRETNPSDPNFIGSCDGIQSFIDGLAFKKEKFDVQLFDDVKELLREHLRAHAERLNKRAKNVCNWGTSAEPSTSSSSDPSKVFTDDMAYEGPSSASTMTSPHIRKKINWEEEYEPFQEGELLEFDSPPPFGPKGPGYGYAAPKDVMGFDPANGFGKRSITSSEEEMFPSTESAKKRVMDKGFAQLDFPKKQKKKAGQVLGGGGKCEADDPLVELYCKPMVQGWIEEREREREREKGKAKEMPTSKMSSSKDKGKGKEILYPNLAASPAKATPLSQSSKKPTSPKPTPSTPTKRPHADGFVDPITLSNKRIKYQEPEADSVTDESFQDHPYGTNTESDDIEAARIFGVDISVRKGPPTEDNGEDETDMDMDMQMQIQDPIHIPQPSQKPKIVPQANKQKAAVPETPKKKTTTKPVLSNFARKFLGLWRSDVNEDQTSPLSLPAKNPTRYSRQSPAAVHHNNPSPKAPKNPNNTISSNNLSPRTSIPSISTCPVPMFSKTKTESDAHGISKATVNSNNAKPPAPKSSLKTTIAKPKTKTTHPTQPATNISPPRFSIVPATPPPSSFSKRMGLKEMKEASTSTLPVPFSMPMTPPPSGSTSMTRNETSIDTPTKGPAIRQSTTAEATANLAEAARKYQAAEKAALKAREQRDAILQEAKAEERKQKELQAAELEKTKMEEREPERKAKSSSKVNSKSPTPPKSMSLPPITTTFSSAPGIQASAPSSSSAHPRYGHFGLIPAEIANAPIIYPSPRPKPARNNISMTQRNKSRLHDGAKTQFHPGDPIFMFGETRYLTALKSRQIEKDLASNDRDVQAVIDRRPLFGMFARFRLPEAPGWWEAEMELGRKREMEKRGREKVVAGRVQKSRKKRERKKVKSFCVMS
ncbi:MAG: hypothetical protein Q9221_008634 [Calogaya cf. arnoldii]